MTTDQSTEQEHHRRSSIFGFIKKVEHKIVHPGHSHSDEAGHSGKEQQQPDHEDDPAAISAARAADTESKEREAEEKREREKREAEAAAAARAAEGDVLHGEDGSNRRRRSLTEEIKDELKHDAELVKKQGSRVKVPVAY